MAYIRAQHARLAIVLLLIAYQLPAANGQILLSSPSTNPSATNLDENKAVGTVVTTFTVTESGFSGVYLTWDSIAGDAGCTTYFQVQTDTSYSYNQRANIVVFSPPDFEAAPASKSYTCNTVARSASPSYATTITVTISINNKFDVTPIFTASSYACSFDEEQSASTQLPAGCAAVFTDSEMDLTSPYTPDSVTCSLSGTHAAYFIVQLTAATKTCTPLSNSRFDRDHIPTSLPASTLTFNIEVMNSVGLKSSRPVTVTINDINDNTPSCSVNPVSVTVAETYTGDIVTSMSCTDIDSGVNAQIQYSLLDPASSRYFSVDSTTGRVSTIVPLDYDVPSKSNYSTVVIKVSDQGSPARSTSVTVSVTITPVNDNTPVWGTFNPAWTSGTAIGSVSENADAGFVVFTAVATDADYGPDGVLTYSIQSAKGSDLSNLLTAFKINSVTGDVSINVKGILDRETITYADITVQANDNPTSSTPLTITRVVRVSISDYNEFPPAFVPSTGIYSAVTVAEGTTAGTSVLVITATDPDASATAVSCTIVGGNTGNVFKMDATNLKQIDVNIQIEPDKPVSQPTQYILAVACADSGTVPSALTATATVTVSVSLTNDNTPSVSLPAGTTITIPENQVPGLVASISASDNDAGTDGNFTCSISPAGGPFSVSASCDQLLLTKLVDRETIPSYSMILTITDGGTPAKSMTLSFTVSLSDIDDNYPTLR